MKKIFPLLICLLAATSLKAAVTFVLTAPPCNNNGILTANFTGLTPPITVTWYQANQAPVTHVVNVLTDDMNPYAGASLSLSAVDANNVYTSGQYAGAPPFTYTTSSTGAVCPALGSATATVTGGLPPYTYSWYDVNTMAVMGTTNPIALPAGNYGVMITDANGCVWGTQYNGDSLYVQDLPAFSYNVATTAANCTNGTATVTGISGGLPPYTFLWSNAATTASITGLSQGYYNVTVTDANGCNVPHYAGITQAYQINVNLTPTPATCIQNNGSIIAFGSGGTPPYSYLWNTGGTTQSISGLVSGYYGAVLTDANGCTGDGWDYVGSSTPITATASTTASSCTAATGSATLTISGGAAPYNVTWFTYPTQTGASAYNLAPGSYSFHITDANSCVRDGYVTISPVNVISVAFSTTSAVCQQANGSATATPSGGNAPYTYLWSNAATTSGINSVAAGNYYLTVTDNIGCAVTKYTYVPAYSPVTIGLASTPASCIFAADGSINSTALGGTLPYTYLWSNGPTTANNTGLTTGNYYLSVTDAVGCTATAFSNLGYDPANNSCYCTITGTVYNDANGNCVQDAGELGIPNIQVHCSNIGYTYTNASGVYSFIAPTGSYTITQSVLAFYPLAACQTNAIPVIVTAAANCTTTVDFANNTTPIHDMHISTWDFTYAIPGNIYTQRTIISNDGTVAEPGIVAGYATDGQINSPTFTPAGVFTAGPLNWYEIPTGNLSLSPAGTQAFYMDYNVPANIPLGTSLVFTDSTAYASPISNWLTDYSPWNNVDYFTTYTVGPYDPNFKEVSPKGVGPTGLITYDDSTLEYMVHFQNIGTYKAQNVVVLDSLDADLDWTTMRPVYQSHPCTVTIDELGVAKFTFNNINLPAKNYDEMGSNGMFTYTIKTKHNLPLGTQFKNSASIYFDFNAPVTTNTTVNTLYQPTSTGNLTALKSGSFTVYPNPAGKNFNAVISSIEDNQSASLSVTDISGRVMMSKAINLQKGTQTISTDINQLASGIYFVNLNQNGKVETQKLVIMK